MSFIIFVIVAGSAIWSLAMNQKLNDAITALADEVSDSQGKLDSIRTFVQGVPELVAVAVREALAEANVEEAAAADAVDSARQAVSDSVDTTLAAIEANPVAGDEAAPTG